MLTTQRHVYVSSVLVTAVQCKWMKNTLAFMVSKYSAGLYNNQEAAVRWNGQLTALFPIGQGTRQGCNVSPTEFNLYAERIMRTVAHNWAVHMHSPNVVPRIYFEGHTTSGVNNL